MSNSKGIPPTPAQIGSAYREAFSPAVTEAAGKDGRLVRQDVGRLAARTDAGRLVADNLANFFDRTGQQSVSARKFIGVVSAYAEREAAKAAGPKQRLSLVEVRSLPADLKADVQHLRGKEDRPPVAPAPPRVTFEEAAMHDFLYPERGPAWKPERVVSQGTVTHDGTKPVLSGLNSVGDWQGAAEHALKGLWDTLFVFRADAGVARLGPNDNGTVDIGPVVNAKTGEKGLLVLWNDIDDNRHAYFYAKDRAGTWQRKDDVFLN